MINKPCTYCRTPTKEICDRCGRPTCGHCLKPLHEHVDGHEIRVHWYCPDCKDIEEMK